MEPQENNALKKGVIGMVAVGLIAGLGIYLSQNKNRNEGTPEVAAIEEATGSGTQATGSVPAVTGSVYKDGSYQAAGTYTSPAGKETVSVSLTLNNDVITAATFKGDATNPASVNWQGKFSEGFSQVVVGKKIQDLSLTVVNGSSLTPKGFMDAVAKITTEAKI